jgi:hypothetical protein
MVLAAQLANTQISRWRYHMNLAMRVMRAAYAKVMAQHVWGAMAFHILA